MTRLRIIFAPYRTNPSGLPTNATSQLLARSRSIRDVIRIDRQPTTTTATSGCCNKSLESGVWSRESLKVISSKFRVESGVCNDQSFAREFPVDNFRAFFTGERTLYVCLPSFRTQESDAPRHRRRQIFAIFGAVGQRLFNKSVHLWE